MKVFANFRLADDDIIFNSLREKWSNKPITFFYDYIPQTVDQLNINPYNFIWLAEPNEFFGMHSWVLNNHNLFTGILTWNDLLLNTCPNAVCFPYHADGGGIGEVTDEYLEEFTKQKDSNLKFEVSFLSGAKSLVEGHKLRQEIYKIGDQITIPKKWFHTLEDFDKENFANGGVGRPNKIWNSKQICFKESMFHIGVENVKHNNWYTEKIADAFATKTIPVYWGCPNLEELGYDERGILRFNSIEELIPLVNSLKPEMYEEMRPYVEYNYNRVKTNRTQGMVEAFFEEFINLNNL
jgi:hypothetical protein